MDINKAIHLSTYQIEFEALVKEEHSFTGWEFKGYEQDQPFSGFVIMTLRNPQNELVTIRLFGTQPNWRKAFREALSQYEPSTAF